MFPLRLLSLTLLPLLSVLALTSPRAASQEAAASKPMTEASAPSMPNAGGQPAAVRVPVIVELFTSEGCSSCPPVDKFLAQIDRLQPVPEALIIPLEEHVDYWDHDGWRDPFSDPAFTDRQSIYAQQFHLPGPATPEVVVAGRAQFLGNDYLKSRGAILEAARSPQAHISLTLSSGPESDTLHAAIRVEEYPSGLSKKDDKAEVRLAVTEDDLASQVKAGENSGKHLEHRATVRKFLTVGHAEEGKPFSTEAKIPLGKQWNRAHLHVVVFLEAHGSHEILGATTASLTP